jgi:hypothetical protein
MKNRIGSLVVAIGRVAGGAVKYPASAITTVATIALAVEQIGDGLAALRAAVKPRER